LRAFTLSLLSTVLLTSCQLGPETHDRASDAVRQSGKAMSHFQVTLQENDQSPGITIGSYTLITDDLDAHRADAGAIMRLKREWPLAMQTKNAALFNRILARDFTFREADGRFYEREAYIRDRVEREETVASAQYENLVLQFFGPAALLTYRNTVKGRDASGRPETWYMTWADIFVQEEGEWKIGASHMIDERVEK